MLTSLVIVSGHEAQPIVGEVDAWWQFGTVLVVINLVRQVGDEAATYVEGLQDGYRFLHRAVGFMCAEAYSADDHRVDFVLPACDQCGGEGFEIGGVGELADTESVGHDCPVWQTHTLDLQSRDCEGFVWQGLEVYLGQCAVVSALRVEDVAEALFEVGDEVCMHVAGDRVVFVVEGEHTQIVETVTVVSVSVGVEHRGQCFDFGAQHLQAEFGGSVDDDIAPPVGEEQ